jgi:hypothetical protein
MNTWELEEHGGNVIENLMVQTYRENKIQKIILNPSIPPPHTHKNCTFIH